MLRPNPTRPSARRGRRVRASLAATTFALTLHLAPPAQAADNPYQRGPDPTRSSIQASRGAFAVSQTSVSRYGVSGFGGGTIYYPTDQSQGRFGAVVVAPGYTARQSSMAWLGPRIASQGFVVFTIDTTTVYDQPSSRGNQLLAAADYLTQRSAVAGRTDAARVAVMGHSMGGGGTLEAAKDRPSLKAAIPLTPWNTDKTWPEISTPTLVIGAQSDTIAPVASHARPFYQTLPGFTPRTYLELRGASHFAPNTSNTTIAKYRNQTVLPSGPTARSVPQRLDSSSTMAIPRPLSASARCEADQRHPTAVVGDLHAQRGAVDAVEGHQHHAVTVDDGVGHDLAGQQQRGLDGVLLDLVGRDPGRAPLRDEPPRDADRPGVGWGGPRGTTVLDLPSPERHPAEVPPRRSSPTHVSRVVDS